MSDYYLHFQKILQFGSKEKLLRNQVTLFDLHPSLDPMSYQLRGGKLEEIVLRERCGSNRIITRSQSRNNRIMTRLQTGTELRPPDHLRL